MTPNEQSQKKAVRQRRRLTTPRTGPVQNATTSTSLVARCVGDVWSRETSTRWRWPPLPLPLLLLRRCRLQLLAQTASSKRGTGTALAENTISRRARRVASVEAARTVALAVVIFGGTNVHALFRNAATYVDRCV